MVKKKIYAKALIISLVVFLGGIAVGFGIENFLASDITAKITDIETSIQETEIEMLYFQTLSNTTSCNFLNSVLVRTNNNLDKLAEQLISYSESNLIFTRSDIKTLKERYTLLLMKSWILQETIKKNCDSKVFIILYFYSTKDCDDCVVQGNVLSTIKDIFKSDVMIYPFDVNVDVSMVRIIMDKYNITTTPSIVAENNVYSNNIISMNDFKKMICTTNPTHQKCSE